MWAMETSEIKNYIFYYKTGKFEEFKHDVNDTCEDFCKFLCHQWNFPPLVQLLFGLRIKGKNLWLAGSRPLVADVHYEFRIRIKIPKIFDLNQLDKNAYDYFYHQVRYDVLHDAIPEIEYPNYKYGILGLCVTDMYLEMIEKNSKIDYLMDNYKNYIPKKLARRYRDWPYSLILKNRIEKSLKSIQENKNYDAVYVKSVYLQQIESRAPNYLTEEYWATTQYPKEDGLKEGKCRVLLQIAPYHPDQPGLRMLYRYKDVWDHVSTITGFYAIQVDTESNQISFEIQNYPQGNPIFMESAEEIESFISCMNLYYRLMVKWNMDLCASLSSPSLKFLTELKIHGPIGGKYSYSKIDSKITEKASGVGTFIIRQCEKVYEIYYIDIVTKANQQIETYKINGESDKWKLYDKDGELAGEFEDLIDLAKSIPTENGKYFRLPPSEYDKSPLLLLCQTGTKTIAPIPATTTAGIRGPNPLVLNATDDLRLYKWEEKNFGDGVFTRMKAEHIQPGKKNVEVTLKILKPAEVASRLLDFMKLADKWAKIDLSEIIKMHGITLQNPISLVLESMKFGPLDEFLRSHKYRKHIILLNLVETAYSLAKALHYLQEKQIVHGRIRCSSLEVTQFVPENNEFMVKLGDPGLPYDYTERDVPWIPVEDYDNLNGSRNNMKADIWAYATTLWEIFSRGATPLVENAIEFFSAGHRLPKPVECNTLSGIYEHIMKSGWDADSDRRFSPQKIFTLLLDYKTLLSRHYSIPKASAAKATKSAPKVNGNLKNGKVRSNGSVSIYNNSVTSRETENTYIGSLPGTSITAAYIDNSSIGSNGGSSQTSLLNGHSSASSESTVNIMDDDDYLFNYSEISGVLTIGDSVADANLIFQGKIGSGNFGTVFQGCMEIDNEGERIEKPVAIKCFKITDSSAQQKDMFREAKIMKSLKHENIVEIYDYCLHPLLIIMEKMSQSLLSYLPSNQPNLTVENLLHFALDIAKGMHYLEQKNIVHRDLAARNVLVNYNNSVDYFDTKCKIADFGLAQFTNQNGYYECSTRRDLPLMWYAPETIEYPKFSSKSDVWSYGVTLFEIFAFGESPDLIGVKPTGEDILNALKSGKRLKCPNFCPQLIYETLLMACWNYHSDQRPNFETIIKKIKNITTANGENV